jgi:hypothetical protein
VQAKSFMGPLGERLVNNGWRIVPIAPASKRPGEYIDGHWRNLRWQEFQLHPARADEIATWSGWPGCGIGIVCGEAVAVDIDREDDGLVRQVQHLAEGILGETPLIRVGRAPRKLLVYRSGAGLRSWKHSDIEFLSRGRQFIAFGIHPVTNRPYEWIDGSPAERCLSDIPEIGPEALEKFFESLGGRCGIRRAEGRQPRGLPPEVWRKMFAARLKEGERNSEITRRAGHLFRRGVDPVIVLGIMHDFNVLHCDPPLPAEDVLTIVDSIAGREADRRQREALR